MPSTSRQTLLKRDLSWLSYPALILCVLLIAFSKKERLPVRHINQANTMRTTLALTVQPVVEKN